MWHMLYKGMWLCANKEYAWVHLIQVANTLGYALVEKAWVL
jgi:hypothetical protein